jgi:TonB-linked SusC/RagA family outer membrane protein
MLIGCLQVSASGFSQSVTLSLDKVPMEQAIKQIKKQTGVSFILDEQLLKKTAPVSIHVTNAPLKDVMAICFSGQPLEYQMVDNIIVVREKKQAVESHVVAPITINGIVQQAATREPIVGASILVKGTKRGTVSDIQGAFSISAQPGDVLVISNVGFAPKEVTVRNPTRLVVQLEVTASSIKDVVVTGVFTRKKESFTGSAITFTQDDILKVGNQNVIQSLRNLDPSFNVLDNNLLGSDPNQLPNIQLRGQTGFPDLNNEYASNPNLPLFILDGFETSLQKIRDLDVYRIQSVTILRDAASKAIYGSRAANGVVVIETKKPAAGKLQVSYNSNLNIEAPDLSSYNLADARQKLEIERLAGVFSTGDQYAQLQRYNNLLKEVEAGVNTYWIAKPLRTGVGHRQSVRMEGGDSYLRYAVDLMYNNVAGAMKGSGRNSISGAITLTYRYKTIAFRNLLTISDNKETNSPYGDFSQYAAMNPYLRATDANGKVQKLAGSYLTFGGGGSTTNNVYNPLWNAEINTINTSGYTDITNNFSIDWDIRRGLKLVGRLGFTKQNRNSDLFYPASHTNFISYTTDDLIFRKGSYKKGTGVQNMYNANLTLNYTRIIGKSTLFANAGWVVNQNRINSSAFTVEGFPNDDMSDPSFALQYMANSRPEGSESTTRDIGVYGAVNYSYDDRFLADLSYRTNASSQFGANKRWGQFWSAGIGWNLHNEAFFREMPQVNQFRLRASTGYTGSQGFNSYMSLSTYTYNLNNSYNNGNGAYMLGLANPDLQWQRKQDNNIGLDLTLWNRIDLRAEYYVSRTNGLLLDVTLPPSAGFSTYKENLGKTENKGAELWLNMRVYRNERKRQSFSIFVSAAHNTNKVLEISNALSTFNDKQDALLSNKPKIRYTPGQSLNAIWAVQSLGIDPASGREVFVGQDGHTTYTWKSTDQVVAGDLLPRILGNFGFNLETHGFMLNTSFRYQAGGQVYNQTLLDRVENANIYNNVDLRVLNSRWQKPGDVKPFKNIADGSLTFASTRFVEDNNQLTMASINLTYDFDRIASVRKAGFSRLRAGFNTNETFVISTMRMERGINYPFARTFSFTLQATF